MGALIFTLIGALVVILCGAWLVKVLWEDENEDETYEPTGATFIQTLAPSYGESEEAFRTRLEQLINETFQMPEGAPSHPSVHNRDYYIAGLQMRCNDPFVTFGFAERERGNRYSSRAVAIYDYKGRQLGYIPEVLLNDYYDDTEGEKVPLIAVAWRSEGELRGKAYTYKFTSGDTHRMVETYMYFLKRH